MNPTTETNVSTDIKLSLWKKVAYGIGDFGNNFSWSFVGAFLMFFYTDVFGISASAVATLLLVTRIWDAINDPIVGALADKTNTRWGRYRPWEIFSAPFCAVLVILTYWAHPTWGDTAKIVYMYVTYGLLVLAYTCVNLPYGTLNSVMTQNIGERAKLSSMRMVFALVAINLINGITNPLVAKLGGGDSSKGFLLVAILYACIFMACHLICFKNVREVVTPPPKQKLPISIQLKAALKNPPFMLAVLGQTMWGLTIHGRNASLMYYFKYVEGNVAFLGLYSLEPVPIG